MTAQKLAPRSDTLDEAETTSTMNIQSAKEDIEEPAAPVYPMDVESITANVDQAPTSSKDDSSVKQVRNRSPAKRISRIEDSVEALDALEDEIEKIGEAIPASSSELSSPNEARKSVKSGTPLKKRKDTASTPVPKTSKVLNTKAPVGASANAPTSKPLTQPKVTGVKANTLRASIASKKPPVTTRRIPDSSPKSQLASSKRVSSIHKVPFQPVKSSKPTTKSSFELPGEAVARRLKEQREERQKREEQAPTKTVQPKPRTLQKGQAPEVKMTATARARLSLAQNGATAARKPSIAPAGTPKPGPQATKRQISSKVAITAASAPTKPRVPVSANTSVKRGSPMRSSIVSRQLSTSSQSRAATEGDLVNQKMRGREVFARPQQMLKAKEDEKKAKEEAAKKARIEAAERGRLASREWAEKQKARKLAAQSAKVVVEGEVAVV